MPNPPQPSGTLARELSCLEVVSSRFEGVGAHRPITTRLLPVREPGRRIGPTLDSEALRDPFAAAYDAIEEWRVGLALRDRRIEQRLALRDDALMKAHQ